LSSFGDNSQLFVENKIIPIRFVLFLHNNSFKVKKNLPNINIKEMCLFERLHKKGVTWIVIFLFFFLSHPNNNIWFKLGVSFYVVTIIMLLVIFTQKVLIKYFLQKQRVFGFFLITATTVILLTVVSVFFESEILLCFHLNSYIPESGPEGVFHYLIRLFCFVVTIASTCIIYFQNREEKNREASKKLKNDRIDMELRYLKSQINPHFLFNALNNIYSMVYTHDDNAADGVLKLSEMLRYVLVDCQADAISIEKERKYIENYIDFQKMRMEGNANIILETEIENSNFMVAPMILQPIVENSFKYSRLENDTSGFVHLLMKQKGNVACFVAQNSIKASTIAFPEQKTLGLD
jgi:Putative regulator of cell autolysis